MPVSVPPGRPPADMAAYRRRLREVFGFPDLRDGQAEVLRTLAERDVLGVMPTGSGKSLCYVLPALELGRTLVVSPLIALMRDQVANLNAAGVPAAFINSEIDRDEKNRRYQAFTRGEIAVLYMAPEGLRNPKLIAGLRRHGVHLLAVDEAHCISQWGHDFRPDYLILGSLREQLGRPATLALTATADPRVRRDVMQRLGIAHGGQEVVTSFDRPNLRFSVLPIANVAQRMSWLARFIGDRKGQAGIVYTRTRRASEEVAEALQAAGAPAAAYHAGMDRRRRTTTQERFRSGETPVIVATNAFGMGIDKPDVRFVIHYQMPGRLESYYQEAGRAGRDGDPAECVLIYARRDRSAQQRFIDAAHPDDQRVRSVWQQLLRGGARGEDADEVNNVLAALRASGLVAETDLDLLSRDPDAPIDTRPIADHRRDAEARLAQMAEYAETKQCRRAVILRYFGEKPPRSCGNCDNCQGTAERSAAGYPEDLHTAILELRDQVARRSRREPYSVFEARTAEDLALTRPRDEYELLSVWGMGRTRAGWFGRDLLELIADWEAMHPDAPERQAPVLSRRRERERNAERARQAELDATDAVADPLYEHLRAWRTGRARREGVPPYTIFSDRTLRDLVARKPRGRAALLEIWGMGEARVDRFGEELLHEIHG